MYHRIVRERNEHWQLPIDRKPRRRKGVSDFPPEHAIPCCGARLSSAKQVIQNGDK